MGRRTQENSKNGNTVTIEECKNKGFASGFDTKASQECQNLICAHPDNNALCSTEGGQQEQQSSSSSAACPSGQIAITGLPFTPSAICIFQNFLSTPPCDANTQTPVMFLNGTIACIGI
jgi:hypothetical protein